MFELWTKSFAEIKCPMDYSLYPFDTQKCRFAMRNIAKNLTYEVSLKKVIEPRQAVHIPAKRLGYFAIAPPRQLNILATWEEPYSRALWTKEEMN